MQQQARSRVPQAACRPQYPCRARSAAAPLEIQSLLSSSLVLPQRLRCLPVVLSLWSLLRALTVLACMGAIVFLSSKGCFPVKDGMCSIDGPIGKFACLVRVLGIKHDATLIGPHEHALV